MPCVYLGQELGCPRETLRVYKRQTSELAEAIECHFGATVAGYETYRYFDGCTKLRSWICMPLIAGLQNRSEGTVRALLGKELMTENGLLTEQGSSTFWDRSTLYALRGIYIAGQADRATEFLSHYARRRLLGDHVPYPIEAWPEGSQRRRKRAFLPRYHRGIVRDSPHRVQELRSYPFNAFRMESHGVAAHSGL